jgi:hypothetical protein
MDFSRHRLSDPSPQCPVVPDIVRIWAKETGLNPSNPWFVALPQVATPTSSTMYPLARRERLSVFGSFGAASPHQEVVAPV